jgi:hypothetical protein
MRRRNAKNLKWAPSDPKSTANKEMRSMYVSRRLELDSAAVGDGPGPSGHGQAASPG